MLKGLPVGWTVHDLRGWLLSLGTWAADLSFPRHSRTTITAFARFITAAAAGKLTVLNGQVSLSLGFGTLSSIWRRFVA